MTKAGLGTPAEDGGLASGNLYRQIFPIRTVWLLAAFALIYIGVEVTLGGEFVSMVSMYDTDFFAQGGSLPSSFTFAAAVKMIRATSRLASLEVSCSDVSSCFRSTNGYDSFHCSMLV